VRAGTPWDTAVTMTAQDVLTEVLALEDPLGALSVYVGVLPEQESAPQPAWAIELRHALDEALAGLERARDSQRAAALRERLEELGDELDLLVSPQQSGRGRALFAGLSGGPAIRVSLKEPFPASATVADGPVVRPLAAALEAGRPAGLLLVTEEALRVCEWSLGDVEELRSIPLVDPGDRRELLGPSASHPRTAPQAGGGFRAGQQRDLYERRVEEAQTRFLAHLNAVTGLARERGWSDVVAAGNQELAQALIEPARQAGLEVVLEPRELDWLSFASLAGEVAPTLEEHRVRRQLASLERVRSEAGAGGRGAVGLADTLAALSEGRVEELLLPATRELRGARAPDGRLFPPDVVPAGVAPGELRPESLLAERMIRQALASGARVSLLRGEAESALAADEAAALLRW
jgi:hypothetical protein